MATIILGEYVWFGFHYNVVEEMESGITFWCSIFDFDEFLLNALKLNSVVNSFYKYCCTLFILYSV